MKEIGFLEHAYTAEPGDEITTVRIPRAGEPALLIAYRLNDAGEFEKVSEHRLSKVDRGHELTPPWPMEAGADYGHEIIDVNGNLLTAPLEPKAKP